MRVMLDTNILVSLIFFPSAVTRDFARRVGFGNRIVLCDYVVEELRLVVERKFPNRKKILEQFFYELPFELVLYAKRVKYGRIPFCEGYQGFPHPCHSDHGEYRCIGNWG